MASALFAVGYMFASSVTLRSQSNREQTAEKTAESHAEIQSLWIPTDSVGFYTLVLAVFTGLLTLVSGAQGYFLLRADKTARVAANAADLSARSAIAIELPIIRSQPIGFGLGISQDQEGNQVENFGLQCFEFKNLGRTKAFPIELSWGWIVNDTLPPRPRYRLNKCFDLNTHINAEDGLVVLYVREFTMELISGDTKKIVDRSTGPKPHLWLYCRLTYEDFMYKRRDIGFCWKYVDIFGGGRFIADATSTYNQRT